MVADGASEVGELGWELDLDGVWAYYRGLAWVFDMECWSSVVYSCKIVGQGKYMAGKTSM